MRHASALAAILLVALGSESQQIEKPIRYTWIATSCETWNCAAAAFVMANGDGNLIILPTRSTERPWVLLRRVEEGSIFIPEDEPFACEVLENVTHATSRFTAIDPCHAPMMLNLTDGRAVVISLQKCDPKRRRSVR